MDDPDSKEGDAAAPPPVLGLQVDLPVEAAVDDDVHGEPDGGRVDVLGVCVCVCAGRVPSAS